MNWDYGFFWIFFGLDVRVLKLTAGVIILAVIGLLIWREGVPSRRQQYARAGKKSGTAAMLFTGLVSGVMTALLVMPGPPLMIYFLRERPAGEAVRALSLSFFALCYMAVTAAYIAVGAITKPAWATIGLLAPVVVAGTCAGLLVGARLSERGLHAALMGLLALSGVGAIVSALNG